VTLGKLFKDDSQVSNKNGNVCRQTDKLLSLTPFLPHRIFKKCGLCLQNYNKDKHLHSAKQRGIKAFNPNMHKKKLCPMQNKTPLADMLNSFVVPISFMSQQQEFSIFFFSSILPSHEGLTSISFT